MSRVPSSCVHWLAAGIIGVAWLSVAAGSESDRQLRVLYAAPQGETPVTGRISIAFSHPMIALGAQSKPAPFVHISPPIEGSAKWHGTSVLEFVPKGNTLPYATHFTVSIDAGVTDLAKRKLQSPLHFEFDTPPVQATFETPPDEWLLPTQYVRLTFEPAVEPGELRANLAVFVCAAGGPAVAVQTVRLSEEDLGRIYAEGGSIAFSGSNRANFATTLLGARWRTVMRRTSQKKPE